MKSFFIVLIVLLTIVVPLSTEAQQTVLQGSVTKTWSVDDARKEVFQEAKPKVDVSAYPAIDPNLIENRQAIQAGLKKVGDRILTIFGNGWYAIKPEGGTIVSYYKPNGRLAHLDFESDTGYPLKSYQHAYPSGKLMRVGLDVTKDESFLFKPSGELIAHWIGNNGYDAKGQFFTTRTGHDLPSDATSAKQSQSWFNWPF